jgi:hypothetical protein
MVESDYHRPAVGSEDAVEATGGHVSVPLAIM